MGVYISTIYLLISKGVDLIRALWHQCVGLKAQRSSLTWQKGKQSQSAGTLKSKMRMFPAAQMGWVNWQLLCGLVFLCQQSCKVKFGPEHRPNWRLTHHLSTKFGDCCFPKPHRPRAHMPSGEMLEAGADVLCWSDCMWTPGLYKWEVGGCQFKEGTMNPWVKDRGKGEWNSTRHSVTLV